MAHVVPKVIAAPVAARPTPPMTRPPAFPSSPPSSFLPNSSTYWDASPAPAVARNSRGKFIAARVVLDCGLVEKVLPRVEPRETPVGIARTIAARSPVAVGILRELARTTRDLPLEEGLRREADGFRRCLESEDGAEGVAAFIEKREPTFTGR